MSDSPLREWIKATRFIPFIVTMSNGRQVTVLSPEMASLGRRRDVISFLDEEGYDRHVWIEHNHVNTIDRYDPIQTPPLPE